MERDRADGLVRSLSVAAAVIGVGGVGVLGTVAAVTIPGKSTSGSTSSAASAGSGAQPSSSVSTSSGDDGSSLFRSIQAPSSGIASAPSGTAHAVTGGS